MTDSTKLRNQHIQTVHRYQCGLCDYNAISANGLKGHIKVMTVSDTHVTNVSMLQQQLIYLKIHKESKHKGVRYPCNKCEYAASTAKYLIIHKESKHEGIRYPCSECEFATDEGNLNKHRRRKHNI